MLGVDGIGGTGNDTYIETSTYLDSNGVLHARISNDVVTIDDSDEQGQIIQDDQTLTGGDYFQSDEYKDSYEDIYKWDGIGSDFYSLAA